jgi:tRNA pseudouridine32 synthase / 23S rRNA pseudouridine746 synthase
MPAPIDPFIAPPCLEQIKIIEANEHFLLINKPSGLLSLSGKHPANKDSVHWRLVQEYPTALMTHRLDLGTSGIMLIALNKTVNANITKQFQNRSIQKKYIAILDGRMDGKLNESGRIEGAIAKGEFPLQTMDEAICKERGKPAQSDYQVLAYDAESDSSRVEFSPLTGRTHQLRIHSQSIGHSILGDDLYGTESTLKAANRLMLHASELSFNHPITGERIVANCESEF